MRKALSLARKGEGTTSPNPHVGSVIVKNDRIIATGYQKKAGLPHAEAIALEKAGENARGADLYVNLEPCNHYGRTPPCTEKIIKAGIKRVIIGMRDPNSTASGGVERLKEAGIEVETGILEKEAKFLNRHFIYWIKKKIPWVSVKVALSADGKMATLSGDSKWITGENARKDVHKWRKSMDVIMVGVNTVIKDDPLLTVRHVKSNHQPARAVVDPHLRISLKSRILNDDSITYIFYCNGQREKINKIRELGHVPVEINGCKDKIKISEILKFLANIGYIKIGVEGGGCLISSFFMENLIGEYFIFYAPKIIGEGLTMIRGISINSISESQKLINMGIKKYKNGDIRLHYMPEENYNLIFG